MSLLNGLMSTKRPKSKGKKKAGKGAGGDNMSHYLSLAMAGSSAQDHFISTDLTLKPVAPFYNAKVPRDIASRITWNRSQNTLVLTTSTTVVAEQNVACGAASNLQQYATWLALFDQYFCDHFFVTVSNNATPNTVAQVPMVYTAIDFDSTNLLGSVAAIQSFDNVNATALPPGTSVTRLVKPCNKSNVNNTANSGVTRSWVDSAVNTVQFFGFRCIVAQTAGGTVPLDINISSVWAFRNPF
jgi:hypothetical protein